MTRQDREIRMRVKLEADDMLFADLHFDEEMKAKVRRIAALDKERSVPIQERRPWKRNAWMAGAIAAAIIGILFVVAPMLADEPAGGKTPGEPQTPGTFIGGPDGGDGPTGPSASEPRVVNGYEEAGRAFGEGLLIPSYIPDGFSLNEISVTGPDDGEATDAIFSYVAGNRSFGVFAQKNNEDMPAAYDEEIDVNGSAGYLIAGPPMSDEGQSVPNVELHWRLNGIHYMLSGNLTGEEAAAVARSMEPYGEKPEK